MISDLLDYAGITFGKVRLVVETIDPYPVVRAAIESVAEAARDAGVEIRASFDEETVRIEADPARLQQIVWNLLTNAIKFSSAGRRRRRDRGAARRFVPVGGARIAGEGIEAEFLPRIFERFSQQDATTTRSHGGLGLGMAIVKQLSEVHGGRIRAESAGQGSRGDVHARHTAEPHAMRLLRRATVRCCAPWISPRSSRWWSRTIDDARELTRRILTDVGATVIEAASAEAAIDARSRTSSANILISDIGMAQRGWLPAAQAAACAGIRSGRAAGDRAHRVRAHGGSRRRLGGGLPGPPGQAARSAHPDTARGHRCTMPRACESGPVGHGSGGQVPAGNPREPARPPPR